MAAARQRQAVLTKPPGALGRLEEISVWLAGVQGACPPRPFRRIRAVIIAGDHGIARTGVSAFPSEVTAQMVANFAAGGAAVNVLARTVGASVRVVDVSVDADEAVPPAAGGVATADVTSRYRVRRGSGRIDVEDALTAEEAARAFDLGRTIVDEEVDAGTDLLVPGEMGIGNTTPSAAIVASLLDREPIETVGRGTGIDDTRWMLKTAAIRDAMRRGRPYAADPLALLRVIGGADLAALTGLLVQAAVRRTPVVLDGVVVCAAALAAEAYAPGSKAWWVAGTRSTEPAQKFTLTSLGIEPLLDLGLRLGEGTGALLAVHLLVAAQATLAEMATFDQAGVSDQAGSAPAGPAAGGTASAGAVASDAASAGAAPSGPVANGTAAVPSDTPGTAGA
ncbi:MULTISPECIES: nicotinate-nucleotide--dimethylbenzimidazole phosphoribosyltransferase [unclassified Frankia]|uniref:nicotinate-nucleotide--dimethylbenzimidazole phosphoribosyltransferase n=1 Tax=unclassified Frankia TaxID=2632575 RepID=UPI0020240391